MPANRLLEHYVDNARALPWRASPGSASPDPYRVWLSEIMLQQTTVAAVRPRFERFLRRWPTVDALAAAEEAEVLREWAGLGYYARARNLHACARLVAARGGFPESADELRRLPGVGDYTAAAIAAFAFGHDEVPIDTNVRRVIARLNGLREPSASEIRDRARALLPSGRAADFAQALMDLGASICRPRDPRCGQCPLSADCAARNSGSPADFPRTGLRKVRPGRFGIAWWIERDGHVRLVRRPRSGILAGMPALPGGDWSADEPAIGGSQLARIRHNFTHFSLELAVVEAIAGDDGGWWQPIDRLEDAGLPTLYRKAVYAALDARRSLAA